MRLALRRRDDQFIQASPDRLAPRIAEDLLGGGIELEDLAEVVHRHDRIRRRLDGTRRSEIPKSRRNGRGSGRSRSGGRGCRLACPRESSRRGTGTVRPGYTAPPGLRSGHRSAPPQCHRDRRSGEHLGSRRTIESNRHGPMSGRHPGAKRAGRRPRPGRHTWPGCVRTLPRWRGCRDSEDAPPGQMWADRRRERAAARRAIGARLGPTIRAWPHKRGRPSTRRRQPGSRRRPPSAPSGRMRYNQRRHR